MIEFVETAQSIQCWANNPITGNRTLVGSCATFVSDEVQQEWRISLQKNPIVLMTEFFDWYVRIVDTSEEVFLQ